MESIIEPLRELIHWFDWFSGFAESEYVIWILAFNSFIESIFFPIPPDPLLIATSLLQPKSALVFAGITTVASVGGAVVGHWLGMRYGRPILNRMVNKKKIESVERLFDKYGAWAVLMAAFTPIPYKVFAITAGMLRLDLRSFIIASFIGRGARFFLLGGLIFFFGASIQEFIETRFELITILSFIALAAALIVIAVISRLRKHKKAVSQ